MNFLDIKAGETIEVGTQKAYRFWRYVFPPHHAPVRLLSWVSDTRWHPRRFVEGTTPDEGEQGIHGFKTMDDLLQSFSHQPEHLVMRSQNHRLRWRGVRNDRDVGHHLESRQRVQSAVRTAPVFCFQLRQSERAGIGRAACHLFRESRVVKRAGDLHSVLSRGSGAGK